MKRFPKQLTAQLGTELCHVTAWSKLGQEYPRAALGAKQGLTGLASSNLI